jgi:hypothetical protein
VRVGLAATDRGLSDASITANTSVALAAATTYAERIARLGAQGVESRIKEGVGMNFRNCHDP